MGPVAYTALLNQTAIHGLPATLNAANTALLRARTGQANATIRLTNHPLPTVSSEDTVKVNQMSGGLRTTISARILVSYSGGRTPCNVHFNSVMSRAMLNDEAYCRRQR